VREPVMLLDSPMGHQAKLKSLKLPLSEPFPLDHPHIRISSGGFTLGLTPLRAELRSPETGRSLAVSLSNRE
jgi:hypothetical protein